MVVPAAEFTVEVVASIALAALVDAPGPVRLHLGVDHLGHPLVGRRPVAIAAAEDGVANAIEGIRTKGIVAQPIEEAGCVVRRGAVVGGRDDHHGPVLRQLLHVVVERGHGGREALGPAVVGDLVRYTLARAQVGAEEDQERRAALHRRSRLGLGFFFLDGWWGRGRRRDRCRAVGARPNLDAEIGRLDGEGLPYLQLVIRVVDELEALQDHPQDQRRLQHGELAPDAGALAGAERLVGVGRPCLFCILGEPLGIEGLSVLAPDLRVAVQHRASAPSASPVCRPGTSRTAPYPRRSAA